MVTFRSRLQIRTLGRAEKGVVSADEKGSAASPKNWTNKERLRFSFCPSIRCTPEAFYTRNYCQTSNRKKKKKEKKKGSFQAAELQTGTAVGLRASKVVECEW